jgi:predicted metal-binding membrane protein
MSDRTLTALEEVASRDRLVVLAGLVGISTLAWAYTIVLSDHSVASGLGASVHAHTEAWTAGDLATTFLMWVVMMVAMMAPTAAPMLLTLARVSRARPDGGGAVASTTAFLGGYLLVWIGFSLLATLAQWQLHQLALVSADGVSRHPGFGGLLLVGAGAFQLTPLKDRCLTQCRTPMFFLMTAWRPGSWGALRMGLHHGGFCVGCCWALMALMFVSGTMTLMWAAGLMLLMLGEKALPSGRRISQIAGAGLLTWGLGVLGSDWLLA